MASAVASAIVRSFIGPFPFVGKGRTSGSLLRFYKLPTTRDNPTSHEGESERAERRSARCSAHIIKHSAGAPAVVDRSRNAFGSGLDSFCRGANGIGRLVEHGSQIVVWKSQINLPWAKAAEWPRTRRAVEVSLNPVHGRALRRCEILRLLPMHRLQAQRD
jgi:hypothetical protein